MPDIELVGLKVEIVGVIGHVEHWGLGNSERNHLQAQLYVPIWQLPDQFWPLLGHGSAFVARAAAAPLGMTGAFRSALKEQNSTAVMYEVHSMEEIVLNSISMKRFSMLLLGVFAGLALVLSAVGFAG